MICMGMFVWSATLRISGSHHLARFKDNFYHMAVHMVLSAFFWFKVKEEDVHKKIIQLHTKKSIAFLHRKLKNCQMVDLVGNAPTSLISPHRLVTCFSFFFDKRQSIFF